uniref:Uncharacterized protein n=1 Tax=Knipowitschia caucasica TaxID=637954 RepID=A0AAV2L4R9_KNICA
MSSDGSGASQEDESEYERDERNRRSSIASAVKRGDERGPQRRPITTGTRNPGVTREKDQTKRDDSAPLQREAGGGPRGAGQSTDENVVCKNRKRKRKKEEMTTRANTRRREEKDKARAERKRSGATQSGRSPGEDEPPEKPKREDKEGRREGKVKADGGKGGESRAHPAEELAHWDDAGGARREQAKRRTEDAGQRGR